MATSSLVALADRALSNGRLDDSLEALDELAGSTLVVSQGGDSARRELSFTTRRFSIA